MITDRDSCIAVAGAPRREVLDKAISGRLEQLMEQRQIYQHRDGEEAILLVQGDTSRGSGVMLTALSEELTPLRSVTVGETVEQCVMRGRTAFLIGNGRLLCYTLDVTASKEHPAGTDEIIALEHRPLCLINSRELLLLTARQLTAALPAAE